MLAKLLTYATEAKKAAVTLVGVATVLVSPDLHLVDGSTLRALQGFLALATVFGVYRASNAAPAADEGDNVAHAG